MLAKPFEAFPVDFHGFKLIKRLGGGFISEAYLAEPPQDAADLPKQICLKLATNKLDVYPGRYNEKSAIKDFLYQKQVLTQISHPFIVRVYPHALLEVPDSLASEQGICTLQDVQASLNFRKFKWSNHFRPAAIKYFAAQMFLAVAHLHQNGIYWDDAKQGNIIVRPDFTLRLIDVGGTWSYSKDRTRDHLYIAGTLHNLSTTSEETFLYKNRRHYKRLLPKYKHEVGPKLHDLLIALLDMQPFEHLLSHPYWSDPIDGDCATTVDLKKLVGKEMDGLASLRAAAWRSLPVCSQTWLINRGLVGFIEDNQDK